MPGMLTTEPQTKARYPRKGFARLWNEMVKSPKSQKSGASGFGHYPIEGFIPSAVEEVLKKEHIVVMGGNQKLGIRNHNPAISSADNPVTLDITSTFMPSVFIFLASSALAAALPFSSPSI